MARSKLVESRTKVQTLSGSFAATLSAGTNYVYSGYGPQLAVHFLLSSSKTNFIGSFGNVGMYIASLPAGMITDRVGPRLGLLYAAPLLSCGYLGLWMMYNSHQDGTEASLLTIALLALCELSTGTGSAFAMAATAKVIAQTFEAEVRATALAITISGIGLSAFFYSTLSHLVSSSTATFLFILAVGTAVSMLTGAFVIQPSAISRYEALEQKDRPRPQDTPDIEQDLETSRDALLPEKPKAQLHGIGLLKDPFFLMIFTLTFGLTGTGLQYINNVGTVVYTLSIWKGVPADTIPSAQAHQIALLSLCNCAGRIIAGSLSDYLRNAYNAPRVTCLVFVAVLMLLSQILARMADNIPVLTAATACLGLSYGGTFGLLPVLIAESFDIEHFGSNFGLLCLSPGIAGQLSGAIFGRIYDHNSAHSPGHQCLAGAECYRQAFSVTIVATGCAILLAIVLTRRSMALPR